MVTWTPRAQKSFVDAVQAMADYRKKRTAAIEQALAKSGAKHIQALRSLDDAERVLDAAESTAKRAFAKRWTGVKIKRYKYKEPVRDADSVSATGTSAKGTSAQRATAELNAKTASYSETLPLLAGARGRAYSAERSALEQLLTTAAGTRTDLWDSRVRLLDAVRQAIHGNAAKVPGLFKADRQTVQRLQQALAQALPPGVADRGDPDLGRAQRSLNSFVVQVGYVTERPFEVYQYDRSSAWVNVAAANTPAVLDIHAAGGLVTDSLSALTSVIVRLLAMNPPGSFKLLVFDRQSYGKVIDYALDLDEDVQKSLFGGPIATTAGDLKSMLDDIERHIGFITQKYLGGKHNALFEYNLSAGSMTEPAWLLVLTGYPDGFSEAYGMSADLRDQLNRIIAAGPATGVYTLILADLSKGTASSLPMPALPSFLQGAVGDRWPPLISAAAATYAPYDQGQAAPSRGNPAWGGYPGAWGATRQAAEYDVEELRKKGARAFFALRGAVGWQPAPALETAAVGRAMARLAQEISAAPARKVASGNVAKLASKKGTFIDPANPGTWWSASSREGLEAPVGMRGTRDVQTITLNSADTNNGLLIGGRAGSGKSTLLHALITELCRRYSPGELQLCLLDLKFGVEFSAYRQLPHARIVGLETGAEFATSVLDGLIEDMDKRSALFSSAGVSNIRDYREKTGSVLPRIVILIDEFTFAFEKQGRENTAFGVALQRIIKQGRGYGIHYVLATQSIAHGFDVPRDALKEIPMRIALRCDETASRLLLADNNPAAALIEHAGEALFNGSSGRPSGNTPFQTTWVRLNDAERASVSLAQKWQSAGAKASVRVFDTRQPAAFPAGIGKALALPAPNGLLRIPLGLPFGLGKAVAARLARASGGNLVAVVPQKAAPTLAALALTPALAPDSRVIFVDFGGLASDISTACEPIVAQAKKAARKISVPLGGQVEKVIEQLAALAQQRQDHGLFADPPITLVLSGLERASALRQGRDAQTQLQEVVSQGPAVGIHTVVITERYSTFEQKLGSYTLQDFDHRVIGPLATDQSLTLADTSDTSQLSATKLMYYERGAGVSQRVLAFAMPPAGIWG